MARWNQWREGCRALPVREGTKSNASWGPYSACTNFIKQISCFAACLMDDLGSS